MGEERILGSAKRGWHASAGVAVVDGGGLVGGSDYLVLWLHHCLLEWGRWISVVFWALS